MAREPRAVLPDGAIWGQLRVHHHVGRGRFGDVYKASDPSLDRTVALKLIDDRDGDSGLDTAVIDEGRLMARVRHPNVAAIYGAQRIDGVTGLWMEFVDGRTLEAELACEGSLPASALTDIGLQLCHALGAVHGAGLVHRDVKASNVIREENGRVVLGDFGTGRDLEDGQEAEGRLVGTPAYLAPEVLARGPATPASDLYSLGVSLFHIATGAYPYPGHSLQALREAHQRGERVTLTDLRPDLPASLVAIIEQALDIDPARRPPSADAMARSIVAIQDAPARRRRWMTAAAGVVVAGVLGTAVWFRDVPAGPVAANPAWVLVTALESASGGPIDGAALGRVLEAAIDDTAAADVIPRAHLLETLALMRRPSDTLIDGELGRELSMRDGRIRAILAGEVDADGGTVTVRLMTPISPIATVTEPVSGGAFDAAVRRAARRSIEVLAAELPDVPQSRGLPRVTTASMTALQYYVEAESNVSFDAHPAIAEKQLREAIRHDPRFVMAYVQLARALHQQDRIANRREVLAVLSQAVSRSDDVSQVERHVATGEMALRRGVYLAESGSGSRRQYFERAEAEAKAVLALQPDNVWAIQCLRRVLMSRQPEYLAIVERWLDQRPNSLFGLTEAAESALRSGERDRALDYLARARPLLDAPGDEVEVAGSRFRIRYLLLHEAWLRGDMPQVLGLANAMAAGLRAANGGFVPGRAERMMFVHATLGQLDQAEEMAGLTDTADRWVLQVLHYRADPARYRGWVDGGRASVAALAAIGEFDLAREHHERSVLRLEPPEDAPRHAVWEAFSRMQLGRVALAERRLGVAISQLDAAVHWYEETGNTLYRFGAARMLAEAYLLAGQPAAAAALLERVAARPFGLRAELMNTHDWLDLRDWQARAYRQLGRVSDAEAIEAELANLLSYADEDHRIRRRLMDVGAIASLTAREP